MTSNIGLDDREIAERTAIATSTLYNPDLESDQYRGGLAKETVRKAVDLGYEIIVVDGGSPDELLKEFERFGAKVQINESGVVGVSRRQAIREACNTRRKIIAWTEPEKISYIPEITKTARPIVEDYADLVVPKRKSLESYPTAQQYAEPLGNAFWKGLTGIDLDVWFGPRTWRRELSDYFTSYDGRYGDLGDSVFIPLLDIIHSGHRIIGIEVEYTHPQKQTEIEENCLAFHRKRIAQLYHLTDALEKHWGAITINTDVG